MVLALDKIENIDSHLDELAQQQLDLIPGAVSGYYLLAKGERGDAMNTQGEDGSAQQVPDKLVVRYRTEYETRGVEVSDKELGLVREFVKVLMSCGKKWLDLQQSYPVLASDKPQLFKDAMIALAFERLCLVLNKYDESFRRSPLSRVFFPRTSRFVGGLPGEIIGRAFTKVLEYGNEEYKTLGEARL